MISFLSHDRPATFTPPSKPCCHILKDLTVAFWQKFSCNIPEHSGCGALFLVLLDLSVLRHCEVQCSAVVQIMERVWAFLLCSLLSVVYVSQYRGVGKKLVQPVQSKEKRSLWDLESHVCCIIFRLLVLCNCIVLYSAGWRSPSAFNLISLFDSLPTFWLRYRLFF